MCRIHFDVHFFRFQPKVPFLAKFGAKNQTCQDKLRIGTLTNSNMQNSVVMFVFSVFDQSKFGPKNQNFQLKLKFGTKNNSNIQNFMVVFTFSLLDRKYFFRPNLVRKIKIVSLTWNSEPSLIPIHGIQWWCSLFFFEQT